MTDLTKPNSLDQATFSALAAVQIQQLSTSALNGLDKTHCQWLTAAQIAAMTPQQIAALAHPDWLTPAAVSGLTAAQIPQLKDAWWYCSPAWFNALTPEAVAALPVSAIQEMSSTARQGLSASTIHAMTVQQVAAIPHPDQLSPAVVSGLTAPQVAAIGVSWGWMSADWLNALTPAAFAGVPPAGIAQLSDAAVKGLGAAAVGAMTSQQAAALAHPEMLSPNAVAAFTPAAIAAIAPQAWSKVSPAWLNALAPAAFAAIPAAGIANLNAADIRSLPDATFQSMTAAQFAAIADTDWVPLSAVGKLLPEQLRLATDWDSASARWLNALSPEAFAAIPPAGINQMSLAALQGLDATRRAIALKSADEIHSGYIDMASQDASVNYDSVLANLQLMCMNIGADGMTASQFDAFNNTLAASRSVTGDPSYVSSLMGNMLRDGVQATMSADAFRQSVDKWFLGTNSAVADSYVDLSDQPLFVGSIQQATNHLAQGGLGDCWLISSLEDIAADSPERLNGLISSNGNGTYAVKFFNGGTQPVFVTVDGKVAGYGAGTGAGAWGRLVEEAYVSACANGLLQGNGYATPWANQTAELDGGVSGYALRSIAGGHDYANFDTGAEAWDAVKAAFDSGCALVSYGSSDKVSTGSDGKTNLVGGHAFSVIGIDEANHKFIFRNPWSPDLVFELSPAELDAIAGSGEFTVLSTPSEYGSAAAHFSGTDWSQVSADWINAQAPAMIAAITPQALGQLSAAAIQGLSASTLHLWSTQQLQSLSHPDQLSATAIAGLSKDQLSAVGTGWVNALSAQAIAALPVAWIASLSKSQYQELSAAMVGALTPQQIAAMAHPDWLSPVGAAGLTAAQIPSLHTSWSYQTADWFNALTPQAVAALPVDAIKNMSSAAVQGLAASTLHAMTPQHIGAFAHPDKLSAAAFGGLTAAQVPSVAVSWYWMSADQLNALSPEAFAAISAAGINQMTKTSLQGLDAIHRDIALRSADATHAGYIKTAPAATTDWSQVSAAGMNALSAAGLAAVDPADLQRLAASTVQGLSAATVAALSPQQIAALPHPELLSVAACAALSATQVPAITAAWGLMSADQLNALSPQAFAAIAASGVNQMSKESLQGLDKTHHDLALKLADAAHAAILNPPPVAPPTDWSTISAAGMNTLTGQALAAIVPSDMQKLPVATVQGLSAATVAALSPQQIAAIPHPEQLSVAAFGALTASQVPAIAASWDQMSAAQINAMSPQAIAALPAQGIKDIEWSAAEKGLSASTVHAMTPQQIAAMEHPDWLSADAFSGLTAAQVPAVSISWGWMSAAQFNALPADALAAVPLQGIRDMTKATYAGLSASAVQALTTQQVAAMAHPDWLAPAAFGALTATQTPAIAISWRWMSADQLNALPAASFAAIPTAGINQMTKASLQGLDAAHHDLALQRADAAHAGYLTPAPAPAVTGSAAPLVQAMASFNVPPAVTTTVHGTTSANAPFTLVKTH